MNNENKLIRLGGGLFAMLTLMNILLVFQNEVLLRQFDKGTITEGEALVWFLVATTVLVGLLIAVLPVFANGFKEWWEEQ